MGGESNGYSPKARFSATLRPLLPASSAPFRATPKGAAFQARGTSPVGSTGPLPGFWGLPDPSPRPTRRLGIFPPGLAPLLHPGGSPEPGDDGSGSPSPIPSRIPSPSNRARRPIPQPSAQGPANAQSNTPNLPANPPRIRGESGLAT
ncbi:MAG: hypothetical protein RLZZ142_1431 [Verrucomicrobiota bacterium]